MPEIDFFSLFTDKFNDLDVRYVVTGSSVIVAFGEPRLTNDIDIVLRLADEETARFSAAFPQAEYYCPPQEVLRIEVGRRVRGHFNLIHHKSGLKADCYLVGEDSFQIWALEHKNELSVGTHRVSFAPLEYVIIKKLQFFREGHSEKHLRDIRSLFAISGELIDQNLLAKYVQEFKLESEWEAAGGGAY